MKYLLLLVLAGCCEQQVKTCKSSPQLDMCPLNTNQAYSQFNMNNHNYVMCCDK